MSLSAIKAVVTLVFFGLINKIGLGKPTDEATLALEAKVSASVTTVVSSKIPEIDFQQRNKNRELAEINARLRRLEVQSWKE